MIPFRRALSLVLIAAFTLQQTPVFAYTMLQDFICDLGKQYYQKGEFENALHEFRNVLLIEPDNAVAAHYIKLITDKASGSPRAVPDQVVHRPLTASSALKESGERETAIAEALNKFAFSPHLAGLQSQAGKAGTAFSAAPSRGKKETVRKVPARKAPLTVITLDENLQDIRMPIEIAKGGKLVVQGQNIRRFLVTEQNVLQVEKTGTDEITVTGKDYGYSYLHVWDARNRWTMEFLGVPPKPEGVASLEDELLDRAEKGQNFKLRYSLDYQSFETGASISDLNRSSYSWNHWLSLTGPTPYGDLDSSVSVRSNQTSTDLTYLTFGLSNGKYGDFEDFNLRLVDFSPFISNLAFSSTSMRGALFNSKAFDKTVDYTVFYGREGGGKYWGLSPSLTESKDKYIEGFEFNYLPDARQLYSLSAFHAWGSDRLADLNANGYDLRMARAFDHWNYKMETAYDSKKFASLLSTGYNAENLKLTTEFRDTDKEFKTMTGTGWRAGEIGLLTTSYYRPIEKLDINTRLDVYKDRLFPNPDKKSSLNEDFSIESLYQLDETASLRADYALQNELGRISPLRSHNTGLSIYKTFGDKRRYNTYATYRHQQSTFFASHPNDYTDEKVILGIRFALISDLYYYLNHEYNWLTARDSGTRSNPWAVETGLDWNRQIFTSPFYGDFRVVYRNEEKTTSPVSFLSGEDYLEWSAELSYRPVPDFESYLQGRLRQVWPETGARRVDLSLYGGLRYTWDTGIKWEPVGDVEGFVFNDDDQDGLKEADDSAVKGVKIKVGRDREVTTDKDGYFYVQGIKGRKTAVAVDTSSLPPGSVLTTPVLQEIDMAQGKIRMVNFGIACRTEITGYVFTDTNGNGKLDITDKPIKGVSLVLEDGKKAVTDSSGRYVFTKMLPGAHTLKLDIDTLSADYLPLVPVFRKINLTEGSSYVYNIPCKKVR